MKPSTKKMEDSDSGMYSPSRQTDSRVTNRSLGTVLTRRKDSIDSGQGASITNTPFPALHSAGARTITGSGCSTMQDKMTSFVKNNFRLYVESLNLDEFEKMACISAWALEKELDDIRKQITDGKANTTTSIDLREVSLGSLRSAASHENSHDAAKASEFRDLDIDQGSLSSCSIQYNHGNSDSEVATCITDLKQESIVLTQIDPRASKFNTSVMDLKQESVVSSHSGNSDIIISDPTNSSTELNKQESLIGSQSADNSDCISMQSSQEASEEEGSNLIVFLNSVEPLDSFHAVSIAIIMYSYICIIIANWCTCVRIYACSYMDSC